jgi:PKHD-type hydroxylase
MREVYKLWPSSLEAGEVDRIIATALTHPAQPGTIFSSRDAKREVRSCTVRWLTNQWIKDLIWSYVVRANKAGFDFAIENECGLQFIEYEAVRGDHYHWHHDVDWNGQSPSDRKISATIQLSDPSEYQGGEFEFEAIQTTADFKSKGTVLVFPSYLRHRIHPVTSGKRYALVAWFSGPRWR